MDFHRDRQRRLEPFWTWIMYREHNDEKITYWLACLLMNLSQAALIVQLELEETTRITGYHGDY